MRQHSTPRSATSPARSWVGAEGGDVVDVARAGVERGLGDGALGGVDRDSVRRAVGDERLDDGEHARELVLGVHGLGARAGRLAADVEQVGALAREPPALGDGRVGVEERAAVRERVGRHVDDAHQAEFRRHVGDHGRRPKVVKSVLPQHDSVRQRS